MAELWDNDWNDELGSTGVVSFSAGKADLSLSRREVRTIHLGSTFYGERRQLPDPDAEASHAP